MSDNVRILVVDSREGQASTICNAFQQKGVTAYRAPDIRKAFRIYRKETPQIILQTINEQNIEISLRFLERVKSIDLNTVFIILSATPSLHSVIRALKAGASDYLPEPVNLIELEHKINLVLDRKRVQRENTILSELAALHGVTLSFFATHRKDALLPQILDACLRITKSEIGSILLWQDSDSQLQPVLYKGPRPLMLKRKNTDFIRRLGEWSSMNNRSLLAVEGRVQSRTSIADCPDFDYSLLCLPFHAAERRFGSIILGRRGGAGPFTENDLRVAEVLVGQASIGFGNAQSYEMLSDRIENLREIQTFAESLMRLTERGQILDFVLASLLRAFGAEIAGVLAPVKRRYELHLSSIKKLSFSFTENIIDTILGGLTQNLRVPRGRVRTIHRMAAISKQSFLQQRLSRHSSFLICPLRNGEEWVGALYIGSSRKDAFDTNTRDQLSSVARQTTIALTNARLYEETRENHLRTIKALAIAVDAKDKYTRGHSENVMKFAMAITEEMGIIDARINEDVQNAALLHDIGKIGVPGTILNKPGKLTADEFNDVMKKHVILGASIVQEIPFLSELVPLVLHHHERYDGQGYPHNLKGDAIPVGARILAVADSFEAMTSNRPYRKALSRTEAVDQLTRNKGTQFDPFVVDVFLTVLTKKFPDNVTENA